MAYQGYLLKIGNYEVPFSIIRAETYQAYINGQDLDSFRNADGVLDRTALEHVVIKVEFETVPLLTDQQFGDFMANIRANYIDTKEKKTMATAFIPELNDYMTQEVYVPDIKPTIYYAGKDKVEYNQIRLAFIGY